MAPERTTKLTLDVPLSVEDALVREAQRQGTTPERLALDDLRRLYAPSDVLTMTDTDRHAREGRAARAARFLEWAREQKRNTPLLSDEAISREAIYGDGD